MSHLSAADQQDFGYILSDDKVEADRLNVQYHWVKECVWDGQSQLFAPVDLAKPGKMVLDGGCGTGIWTMDMAQQASLATTFYAVDYNLSTFRLSNPQVPPNVHALQLDLFTDFVAGQDWPNKFDLINQRLMLVAFRKDQELVLKSYIRALRPGGYLQLFEFDMMGSTCDPEVKYWRQWLINSALKNGMTVNLFDFLPDLLVQAGYTDIQRLDKTTPFVEAESDEPSNTHRRQLGQDTWLALGGFIYKKLEEAKAITSAERADRLAKLEVELRNSTSILPTAVWVARKPKN